MFVVAAGNYAVSWVAEGYGEDSGGVGAVEYGSVGDLPGLAAVWGVEDAGGAATGGEPDVGVEGGFFLLSRRYGVGSEKSLRSLGRCRTARDRSTPTRVPLRGTRVSAQDERIGKDGKAGVAGG